MPGNDTIQQQQLILSPIPISDFIAQVIQQIRPVIKAEIEAAGGFPKTEKTEYLSRRQVAKSLHITLATLNTWTKSGKLQSYRINRRVLYKSSEIELALKQVNTANKKPGKPGK